MHLCTKPGQLKIFSVCVSVRTIRSGCLISATRRMQTLTQMKHSSFVLILPQFFTCFHQTANESVFKQRRCVCTRVRGIYLFCACLCWEDVATVWCYWHLWDLDVTLCISWVFSQFQVLLTKINSCLDSYEYPNGWFEHILCLKEKQLYLLRTKRWI